MARKKKTKTRTKEPAPERFCVIQPVIASGPRTFFTTEDGAVQHGVDLVDRKETFPNYRAPAVMLVVKVVKVIVRGDARVKPLPANLLEAVDG